MELFTKHGVLSETEIHARYEIMLENYIKTINIEALTMIDMVNKDILPAISAYIRDLSKSAEKRAKILPDFKGGFEEARISALAVLERSVYEKVENLEELLVNSEISDSLKKAEYFRSKIFVAMQTLRTDVDAAERITSAKYWPYPSYGELLFGVR